jgi:hypothetical protein
LPDEWTIAQFRQAIMLFELEKVTLSQTICRKDEEEALRCDIRDIQEVHAEISGSETKFI